MRLRFYSYRYAEAVLRDAAFAASFEEVGRVLQRATTPLLDPQELNSRSGGVKRRDRGPRCTFLPVDQKKLNRELDDAFRALAGWALQPHVVVEGAGAGPRTRLKGDYKKGRLQVEVQFGNMARWYTDVFKFQLSYSLDRIDVGILAVPLQRFALFIDENIAYYERVIRELPWAKMSLTLPILVIGLDADNYEPIRDCYEQAALVYGEAQRAAGKTFAYVPFGERLQQEIEEEPAEDDR